MYIYYICIYIYIYIIYIYIFPMHTLFLFTGELFYILVDYPDSTPALDDLFTPSLFTPLPIHTLRYVHPFLCTPFPMHPRFYSQASSSTF